jgi:putative DNA methylase
MTKVHKKLIEVALPLAAINKASVREGYIYRGNPSALHKWWAQRPLAAARAVIFAQMVDDPSAHPDLFPTVKKQEKERLRLFRIIENLVQWENIADEKVLQQARDEIWQSWRYACAENADHPLARNIFDRYILPPFHDPFAGGGALPLEAQRLGLKCYASDLNPVAVLINKAMIEAPPKFANRPALNPESRDEKSLLSREWMGVEGLAEDVRYYGQWMRNEARKRIGHLYPQIEVTAELAKGRPDLKALVGQKLVVIAWLWARTVKSPNPAFAEVEVPLASTFMISTKSGKEAYVEPVIEGASYNFTVKVGKPKDAEAKKNGTKLARANFTCLMSGAPISGDYIKAESRTGRMGAKMMAIVAVSERGRVYLPPTAAMEAVARQATPKWRPNVAISGTSQYIGVKPYGLEQFSQLFSERQLVALTTFSDLVQEAREHVMRDARTAGLDDDGKRLANDGTGASAYADAVATLLAFSVDKTAEYGCTSVVWYSKEDRPKGLFARQAIPMVWDYAEVNPLADIGGGFAASVGIVAGALSGCAVHGVGPVVKQLDAVAQAQLGGVRPVVSTDPPYYDNVPYADLSDFFYIWLRESLKSVYPDLFVTLAVPKADELVAFAYRHDGKAGAEKFFLSGMTQAMHSLAEQAHPAFPVTIYYAFRQSETENDGTASTGWETFLDSVIKAGFALTGTWPMRTERASRSRGIGSNALASSIVLVCRKRAADAPTATRREFITSLKAELPQSLAYLQRGNIAPVDLAQAAIGPGMAVYTRYSRVLDAEGRPLEVRDALALINQTLDETLAEQEGDIDADSRWALTWFEQYGFAEGEYGVAEQLSKSKNTSVAGMVEAGIIESKRSKVRLFRPEELPGDWDPTTDARLTAWEIVHHLIRVLARDGEGAAAELMAQLGAKAETARELCYRLYTSCERKKRAAEALAYNGLVQSWPEISRLAREGRKPKAEQMEIVTDTEE